MKEFGESCGVSRAHEGMRIVEMAFLKAHAEKPHKQSDMGIFLSSDKYRVRHRVCLHPFSVCYIGGESTFNTVVPYRRAVP